jgi:fatty-acyl-CoA synthase
MSKTFSPLKDITIGRLLGTLSAQLPDQEALVYPSLGVRWTFAELEAEARRSARGLMALGIEKGDRVAVWATNVPEWVVLEFALAKVGAILVTVNTALSRREVQYLLQQSEANALFLIDGFKQNNYVESLYQILPDLERATPGTCRSPALPYLRHVVFIGDTPPKGMLRYAQLHTLAEQVSDQALDDREATLHVDEVINMQYTSGTTGFPKGVMLSHRNIVNNAYHIAENLRYTPSDRLCLPVPLFHCFGCVIGVLGAYTHGVTLVPLRYFEPEEVLQTVEREKCTALYGVPTMFIAELEHGNFKKYALSSLRTGVMAGSLCPVQLMRRVIQEMNLSDICIAYGLTEASPGVTITAIDDSLEKRTETVGRALPEVEVKIINPLTGAELPRGQQGELVTRGYHVMKGYYKNEAATRQAITEDGWLHTGDLAVMDEQGYATITGRIKEMIIRGGENVYPKEIEEFLRTHPKISDVAVYGVPSDKYGEEVAAAIKLKPGETATAEEIIAFCEANIARFKIPRLVQFVDAFPMTASGKIQKFILRERASVDFER